MISTQKLIGAGGAKPLPTLTYTPQGATTGSGNSFTFSAASIGAAPATGKRRYIVVVQGGASDNVNQNITPTSVTINSNAATLAVQRVAASTSYKQYTGIHYLEVSTGTTATITITGSFPRRFGLQLYAIYINAGNSLGVFSTSATEGTATLTNTVNIPSGASAAFAAAQYRNGETTLTLSFTGTLGVGTPDYRADILSNENFYAGSVLKSTATAAATGRTVSITDTIAAAAESTAVASVFYPV